MVDFSSGGRGLATLGSSVESPALCQSGAAIVAGVILGFFVRSYVELVRVVIDMLLPQ